VGGVSAAARLPIVLLRRPVGRRHRRGDPPEGRPPGSGVSAVVPRGGARGPEIVMQGPEKVSLGARGARAWTSSSASKAGGSTRPRRRGGWGVHHRVPL